MSGQPAIIGQQQQPFGVHVQTTNRQHAWQVGRQMIEDGLAVLLVTRADDKSARFVVTPKHCRLARRQRLVIHGDDIGRCDVQRRACDHLAIHRDPTFGDTGLSVTA